MSEDICRKLESEGFIIDYYFQDEEAFGNIIINAHLESGMRFSFIRDRGFWDCDIMLGWGGTPIVAFVYIVKDIPFTIEDTAFDSENDLIRWLHKYKDEFYVTCYRKMKVLVKWTIKTM